MHQTLTSLILEPKAQQIRATLVRSNLAICIMTTFKATKLDSTCLIRWTTALDLGFPLITGVIDGSSFEAKRPTASLLSYFARLVTLLLSFFYIFSSSSLKS